MRLDLQIRLLDGHSVADTVTTSEDAAVSDSWPTAPMVSGRICIWYSWSHCYLVIVPCFIEIQIGSMLLVPSYLGCCEIEVVVDVLLLLLLDSG